MSNGIHTHHEIWSQPAAWDDALAVHARAQSALAPLLAGRYDQVIFTGCGSTYYLSLAAAALFQEQTGRSARAVPAGELLLNPAAVLTGSRSRSRRCRRRGVRRCDGVRPLDGPDPRLHRSPHRELPRSHTSRDTT